MLAKYLSSHFIEIQSGFCNFKSPVVRFCYSSNVFFSVVCCCCCSSCPDDGRDEYVFGSDHQQISTFQFLSQQPSQSVSLSSQVYLLCTYVRSFLQEFLLGEIVELGPVLGKGDPDRLHQGTQIELLDHGLQPQLHDCVGPLLGICVSQLDKEKERTLERVESN